MNSNVPQLDGPRSEALVPRDQWAPSPDQWVEEPRESGGGLSPRRIVAALLRQKWVLALSALLGLGAGYLAYHSVEPQYTTSGNIWINTEDNGSSMGQPITQGELFPAPSWENLLSSFQVLDPVVLQERLYLQSSRADSVLFAGFTIADLFYAGEYLLAVSEDGQRWSLETGGEILDEGVPGDSIGVELGFLWQPPASELVAQREVSFQVVTPRDASLALFDRLRTGFGERGQNFVWLELSGTNPERITRTLTAVMGQYLSLAAELKSKNLVLRMNILKEQVDLVESDLSQVEAELQNFQVATITLPSDETGPIAPGLEATQGTVIGEYFQRRVRHEELLLDRDRIAGVLNESPGDTAGLDVVALELIPSIRASSELQGALDQLVDARSTLRGLQERYTAEHQLVRDAQERVQTLERQTIPSLARVLMARLDQRASEEQGILDTRAQDLREIPARMIREAQLERERDRLDELSRELQNRYATGQLAAASSIPDVDILDWPQVPTSPDIDERARWGMLAFLSVIGVAVAGVILLEMLDPRIRYPLQVQDDLGMEILGAIPRIRLNGKSNTGEVTEAFREIRMRLEFSYGSAKPLIVAITSPDTGEGKTLVSANLAIAFSQLRKKTLLIDADTRRGDIHELLEMNRKPGLTEALSGAADETVIRPTNHPHLHFVGSGSRASSSPELLSGGRMLDLMAYAKRNFDVILVDCPPMAAGSDAFVLGAHTGAVLFIMRSGSTHRELAKAKMEAFYRLPVRILGAVLNDVDEGGAYGQYRYYSYYLPGYRAGEEHDEERNPEPATL